MMSKSLGWFRTLTLLAVVLVLGPEIHASTWPGPRLSSADSRPGQARFAVIGDYGIAGTPESDVAAQVRSWQPDFIATVGDNNYPLGAANSIDANVGQYYHDFIYPYLGAFGAGAAVNRFFPVLGNHDWYTPRAQPYLDYFALPGNERYYRFVSGPVELFMLDSDSNEPDGITADSTQAGWLQAALAASVSRWKIVLLHHAPYSSGPHGSNPVLQWPYQAWGADAVIAGHDHTYERIVVHGLPYFVDGLGGAAIYNFGTPVAGSLRRYNSDYGAMLVDASSTAMVFRFVTRAGVVVDTYQVPFINISGNAGVAGAAMSYTDGTANAVTADVNGDYSLRVSRGWSGGVTPSKSGYTFSPAHRDYVNLTADASSQDYVATVTGVGKYDDTAAGWAYTGSWVPYSVPGAYNNTVHIATAVGSAASFTFLGDRFTLTYASYPGFGSIGVYLDGSPTATVTLDSNLATSQRTYTSPLMTLGVHSVVFKHAGPVGTYIALDALEVTIGKYDDTDAGWSYGGSWVPYPVGEAYNNTVHIATAVGSTATFGFSGSDFTLTYVTYPGFGLLGVYVDGSLTAQTTLDTNGAAALHTYTSPALASGAHTLKIVHAGLSGTMIAIDALQITP